MRMRRNLLQARYIVTVTPVSDSQTVVGVRTWDASVLIATNVGIHGGNYIEMLAPTTIEEYRFLLAIGKAVGEQGMPPLHSRNDFAFQNWIVDVITTSASQRSE